MRKIILAGGSGFLGNSLIRHFHQLGDRVIVLTRGSDQQRDKAQFVHWDGRTIGNWMHVLEEADVLINLNGKSVDCRYTEENKRLIYASRLESTEILGKAIHHCSSPPKVWINAASATIYRHSLDKEMDEYTGEMGEGFSVDVCQKWEAMFNSMPAPRTRRMLIRTGIVLGKHQGPLKPLKMLTRFGLGGAQGKGNQYFSWLHEDDFAASLEFLIRNESATGVYNITAPVPIPNLQFMKSLRKAMGIPRGLPSPIWLLEFGAVLIRTETELILKSRRVVPRRLLESGYTFKFKTIDEALSDLCR